MVTSSEFRSLVDTVGTRHKHVKLRTEDNRVFVVVVVIVVVALLCVRVIFALNPKLSNGSAKAVYARGEAAVSNLPEISDDGLTKGPNDRRNGWS